MTDFVQGDTVYTQDGTQYYFDHAAGEHGYVSPIIIIQTTNYHGDDFDEHEEVADHMVPIRLTHLSKTPWVRKIHEETKQAQAEQTAILNGIQTQIGAARTELRAAETEYERRGKELENEGRILERRFQWVKDFKRMTSDETVCFLGTGETVPSECTPRDIRLKRDTTDESKYHYLAQYCDEDDPISVYPNRTAMENAVHSLFNGIRDDLTVEQELKWQRQWPKLVLSDAARETKLLDEENLRKDKLQKAQVRLDAAQAEVEKWQ